MQNHEAVFQSLYNNQIHIFNQNENKKKTDKK